MNKQRASFGGMAGPKRENQPGKTWSRAPRNRLRPPEDPEQLAYIARCWERDPQMVVTIGGLDRDRLREHARDGWADFTGAYGWAKLP